MNDVHDASSLARPERLAALKASGLLRHGPQDRLDLLCETATMILRVPMSQVNVLDDKFQVSIGKWPPDDKRKARVQDTGCQEVILAQEPVIIPNTLLHPTVCMAPFVTVAGCRAYLGVPIYFGGEVVGSFCAADKVVRDWTTWDVAGLQGLARLAGLAVAHDD